MNTNTSSYVNYNGHGMIERYPKNMSLAYVTSHERRHKVHNQLTALSTGETVQQSLSYKVTISSDGVPVAVSAVTKSTSKKQAPTPQNTIPKSEAFLSKGDIQDRQTLLNAVRNSAKINQQLREVSSQDYKSSPSQRQKEQTGQSAHQGTSTDSIEETRLRNRAAAIQTSIKELKTGIQKREFINSLEGENPHTSPIPSPSKIKNHHQPPTQSSNNKEDQITLREFDQAFVKSFRFMQNDVPGVTLNDGVGSALRMRQTLKNLKGDDQDTFLHHNFKFRSDFVALRNRERTTLSTAVSNLNSAATAISDNEKLNISRATSSDPSIATATPSFNTPTGSYTIHVSQIARGGTTVSSEITDPYAALNYEGEFRINGYTISVVTSDSLNDIKDKINFGEDLNKNGNLDFAEDLNNNGRIETKYIRGVQFRGGFTGSFYLSEDVNFNQRLDVSEDLNNNKLLDGGEGRIGVTATLERNRLVLQNHYSSNVQLQDTDGILQSLGFYVLNGKGASIPAEVQFTDEGKNLNINRRKAQLVVNDKIYKRESNTVNDIIPNATISINKSSALSARVSIKRDFFDAVDLINQFKESYNRVITMTNNLDLSNAMLDTDSKTQGIRSSLTKAITERIENASSHKGQLSNLGITMRHPKRSINQNTLTNLENRIKRNAQIAPTVTKGGANTIRGALEKGGVSSSENNTLHIDNTKLLASLKRDLQGSSLTITGADGLSQRIRQITASALSTSSGSIQIQKNISASYIDTEALAKKERSARNSTQSDIISGAISGAIIRGGFIA